MLAELLVILMFVSQSFCERDPKDPNPPIEDIKPSYVYVRRVDYGDSYLGESYDVFWEVYFRRLPHDDDEEDLVAYSGIGHFDVKKRIDKWTGDLNVLYCTNDQSIDCTQVMKYSYDGCKSFEAEGEWYSQYIQKITPKLKCPVEPGRYTLNNVTAAHFGEPKLALGYFLVLITGVDENGDKRFVLRANLVGAPDTNQMREIYGVPRDDHVPEDEEALALL